MDPVNPNLTKLGEQEEETQLEIVNEFSVSNAPREGEFYHITNFKNQFFV